MRDTLILVASANILAETCSAGRGMRKFGKSFLYVKKSKGSVILPYETPQPFTLHFWFRFSCSNTS